MRRTIVSWSIVFAFILAFSALGYAENEDIHGQIKDAGGKPLPGATVKVVNNGTGETAQAQADKDGIYRIPLRTGNFTVTSTLDGFGNASQTVDVLVGDQPEVNFQMTAGGGDTRAVATAANAAGAGAAGNVTSQQVENLPSNGRNMMDLTLQAPRSDQNAVVNDVFVAYGNTGGNAQILMDGQQLTTIIAQGFGQAHFSKDAVEQLQMGDRFDATQGRSSKLIVQQVTKSGTNQFLGRASGYFRTDKLNSPDYLTINPATNNYETLPYNDQQYSFTFGGPIIKNKLHFFANYEYERNPQSYPYTTVWNGVTADAAPAAASPFAGCNAAETGPGALACPYINAPSWNRVVTSGRDLSTEGARVDWQLRGQDHWMARVGKYKEIVPLDYTEYQGTNNEPSAATGIDKYDSQLYSTYSRVLSSKSVNVIRGGYANFHWTEPPQPGTNNSFSAYNAWNGYPAAATQGDLPLNGGEPNFSFTDSGSAGNAFVVGANHSGAPEYLEQSIWTVRDDYTHTGEWHGAHTFKTGGEWLNMRSWEVFQGGSSGTIGLTIPNYIMATLPNYFTTPGGTPGSGVFNVDTWNMAALSPYATTFSKAIFGPQPDYKMLREYYAGWAQDDWQIKPRLLLSLGARYDIATNLFGESEAVPGLFNSGRPIPKNAFGPRFGFTYKITPKTIMRGGIGKYFADVGEQTSGVAGARENEWQTAAFVQYSGTAQTVNPKTGAAAGGTGFDGKVAPTLNALMQAAPQLEGYTSTPAATGTGNPTVPVPGSVLANFCVNNNASGGFSINAAGNPGCVRPGLATPGTIGGYGWSDNANIGIQRLWGKGWIINSDFYWEGGRHNTGSSSGTLLWNPDGTNEPFNAYVNGVAQNNNAAAAVDRAYPNFGTLSFGQPNTLSNYLGLTTTVSKRVGALTGTLTWTWSEIRDVTESKYGLAAGSVLPSAGTTNGIGLLPFAVQKGFEGLNYYSFAGTDQRNRANFNFLYKLPHGVSLSGLYFFGSGQALSQSWSFGGQGIEGDGGTGSGGIMPLSSISELLPTNKGVTETFTGIRTDAGVSGGGLLSSLCTGNTSGNTTENPAYTSGCLLRRNGFHPKQIDRVDMRLTKTIKMGERVTTDVFIEAFNLLNHENFNKWNTTVNKGISNAAGVLPTPSASDYGLPGYDFSLPFQARMAQFGFKVDFKL